jgi:hypothetical protein
LHGISPNCVHSPAPSSQYSRLRVAKKDGIDR